MRRAVDIGIVVAVKVGSRVDDGLRLLRGRGVVEPDERVTVDALVQHREIAADGVDVEDGKRGSGSLARGAGQRGFYAGIATVQK